MSAAIDLQLGELIEAFEYLDDLRESGRTNMYGAAAYLQDELCWDRREAGEATRLWMKTFDGDSTVEERATKALEQGADQ